MTTIVGITAQTPETAEQMPTYRHGDIIAAIIAAMRPYALSHRLGRVFAPQTTYHKGRRQSVSQCEKGITYTVCRAEDTRMREGAEVSDTGAGACST